MFEVYAPDLTLLGIIEKYNSMQWLRRYTASGQFELHCPYNALLAPENIIRNGNEAGIIESVMINNTPEQGIMAEVHGRLMLGLLSRRIIWGLAAYRMTAENVIRQLVINNTSGDRTLGITVAAAQGYTGNIDYQNSYGNLLNEISAIAEFAGLGVDVSFPGKVFSVYKGLDRTSSQSVNPRAIFSQRFENVLSSQYSIDRKSYKNVALIAGQGEGEERLIATVGTVIGLDRHELFVDARDIGPGTIDEPISEPTQLLMLAQRGNEKLSENKISEAFTANVDPQGNLKYKTDYDLGDIVTVKDFSLSADARITEIKEIYEDGGMMLELTLGYERVMRIG